MQLAEIILTWLREGKTPEKIVKDFFSQVGVRSQSQQDEILAHSRPAIEFSRQLGETEEARQYLMTLFRLYTGWDEWIALRVLGEISKHPAFGPKEKQDALTTLKKRLTRLSTSVSREQKPSVEEYDAYYHGLQASLAESQQKWDDACAEYKAALSLYSALGRPKNRDWAQAQLDRLTSQMTAAAGSTLAVTRSLNSSSGESRAEVLRLKTELAALSVQVEEQKKLYEQLRVSYSIKGEQIAALMSELDLKISETIMLNGKISVQSNSIRQLTAQINADKDYIQQLTHDLAQRDQQIAQLQQENQQAQAAQPGERNICAKQPVVLGLNGDIPDFFKT